MLHEFFIQGYTITALILSLLYFFHAKYRETYLSLARMANRLLWLYSLFTLVMIILGMMSVRSLELLFLRDEPMTIVGLPETIFLSIFPFGLIIIALMILQVRTKPFWVLAAFVILLNLSRIPSGPFNFWRSLLYGLLFGTLMVISQLNLKWVKKAILREDNGTMPDRI